MTDPRTESPASSEPNAQEQGQHAVPADDEPATATVEDDVLLVEDDDDDALTIEAMLLDIGYHRVVRVATVEQALQVLQSTRPSVAVLDASLRGMSAYRVAAQLRDNGVPFVVSTGYDPNTLPGSFQSGIALRKPYARTDLFQALEAAQHHPS